MTENKSTARLDSIEWVDGNIPLASRFDDTYYARTDGLGESRHVFIGGNDLIARWPHNRQCLIAELGFGTGLNFLATVEAWRKAAAPDAELHFVSFEQYPLDRASLQKALGRWPQLAGDATQLAGIWDTSFEFLDSPFGERVRLTVFFSDANIRLPQCDFAADAWYLDGFSPAKNPQLWSPGLMGAVFQCTRPGGSFATYSAAGWVRRNLQAAGFGVEKRPGFGTKREMLTGTRPAA